MDIKTINQKNKRESDIEIKNNTIDECMNLFADWFGYNYQNQGYYKLLKQLKEDNLKQMANVQNSSVDRKFSKEINPS